MAQHVSFEDDTFTDEAKYTDKELQRVANLAQFQKQLEHEVATLEDKLDKVKKRLRTVRERDLPDLMAEIGLKQVVLHDGSKVDIDESMFASISRKNKPAAIEWLIQNDHASLVKTNVVMTYDKGQHEAAEQFASFLESNGFNEYKLDENVNTSSVKAAIKEMLAQGIDVPLELFGVHFVKQSKIT